jgi:hypothetical protein
MTPILFLMTSDHGHSLGWNITEAGCLGVAPEAIDFLGGFLLKF